MGIRFLINLLAKAGKDNKMKKRFFALALVFCMLLAPLSGCNKSEGEWLSEEIWVDVENEDSNDSSKDGAQSGDSNDSTDGSSNNAQSGNNSQGSGSSNNKRPANQVTGENAITTTMTGKDPNANYKVSGKVSVAVNTNRPTDYEAMFEAFQAVYKDVDLEIRYFSDGDKSGVISNDGLNFTILGTL
jgi:hypothetical protein